MGNLDLYEKVRSVPENAKKKIQAGRTKGFTDINPMWRIKTLTEQFGICGIGWYFKVINKWTEKEGEETAAFVEIELYIKVDGEWSMPIYGTGGSRFATKERGGIYVSDECYKMATTDALSVACKHIGIGADVYFEQDISKYNTKETNMISDKEKNYILSEVRRSGAKLQKILARYKITDLDNMTKANYEEAIEILSKYETIPPPCPDQPKEPEDNPELPFR